MINYAFYNVMEEKFVFGGNDFYNDQFHPFPDSKDDTFAPKSGGLQIRFLTNSKKIKIIYNTSEMVKGNFPQVGITARAGITILYRKINNNFWKIIDCDYCKNIGTIEFDMTRYEYENTDHEIMICLPILSFLTEMQVGIESNSQMESISKETMSKILFLGGVNSYGIGCTCSASMLANILARKENAIIYNFSFNQWDFLKYIYNKISEFNFQKINFDYVLFEGDYVRQNRDIFFEMFPKIMLKLISLNVPIILWNVKKENYEKSLKKLDIDINSIVRFVDTDKLLNENNDMCMYSPNFINDTANALLYKAISSVLN